MKSPSPRKRALVCLAVLLSLAAYVALTHYPADGVRYQSELEIGGIPLIDVRLPAQRPPQDLSLESELDHTVARGFLAIGPIAVGAISLGGLAIGMFSFGIVSLAVVFSVAVFAVAAGRAVGVMAIARWPYGVLEAGRNDERTQVAAGTTR